MIDARFEIVELAGTGGMGTVYRAVDRASGAKVALKLLRDREGGGAARFAHEAKVLAQIDHPHVVRYVAHGVAPGGDPYLAMEWLEGENLAERLSRAGLGIHSSVRLARLVASALGAAHAQGIVHRDIKPSNLFLMRGSIEQVKVLDFGIARREQATTALTMTGSMIGTPGYMAPEQARGEHSLIDARADVFSLGCVLFECLTGKPAFQGTHVIALLAKLLFDDPPRVRQLTPDVPAPLDALVSRMLAKDKEERPSDGAAVGEALDELDAAEEAVASQRLEATESLTGKETRMVSVVAMAPPSLERTTSGSATMVDPDMARRRLAELRQAVKVFGAKVEELASGALVAMVAGRGHATDQAALAARCALRLRALVPEVDMVLVTGRSEETQRLPVGELLDRAAALMEHGGARGGDAGRRRPIRIDEQTQALLDVRFDVAAQEGRVSLKEERMVGEEARTLLGKPSLFVGRDREIRSLLEHIEESFDEERSHAILITANAGVGKSRLRYELLRQLRERRPDLRAAIGRGDSIAAGSAFGMLGAALRGRLGIAAGEPTHAQREKLSFAARVVEREIDRQRVTEFLGEMIGTPFPDEASPMLRAARQSPSLMAEQIQAAYIEFARSAVNRQPVLLMLEDLHWGDAPSIKLIDAALRELKEKPFAVIAFARPEVHERFPKLWAERSFQEIRLRELPRRAAESLVRSTLGEAIEPAKVQAIVDRADGNAFYLEELIRAVADGQGDAWPETVLGMAEARLAALDPEARRLLRAASVFGEVFWKGGIPRLLGEEVITGARDHLSELVEGEVLVRHPESRLSGEEEYAFRHALLREGAYAMLTERDRALGHKLAGEWLEQAGETDAKLLAQHFCQGGEGERAARYYLHAGEQAFEGSDLDAARRLAEQGIALGQERELLAELWALVGEAAYWSGDFEGSLKACQKALDLARPGSKSDCRALASLIGVAHYLCKAETRDGALERLLSIEPEPDAILPLARGLWIGIASSAFVAHRRVTERYLHRLEQVAARTPADDDLAMAWLEHGRAVWLFMVAGDPWAAIERLRAELVHTERAGDHSQVSRAEIYIGRSLALLGLLEEAEPYFVRALANALPGSPTTLLGQWSRCLLLVERGLLDEARALASQIVRDAEASGEVNVCLHARLTLLEVRLQQGEIDAIEAEAFTLGESPGRTPHWSLWYLTVLAQIRLAQGRGREALELAERALSEGRSLDMVYVMRHAALLLVRAEALAALGDRAAAHTALREARDDLLAQTAKIPDAEVRRSFLENRPTHARTLTLAREWLGEN